MLRAEVLLGLRQKDCDVNLIIGQSSKKDLVLGNLANTSGRAGPDSMRPVSDM